MTWEVQLWEYGKAADLSRLEAMLDRYREAQNFVVAVHPETDWWIVVGKSDCERSRQEAEAIVAALNRLEAGKVSVRQPASESSTAPRFGELFINPSVSQRNPHRIGYFVRQVRRQGCFHKRGRIVFYELTDGAGDFWEVEPQYLVRSANQFAANAIAKLQESP